MTGEKEKVSNVVHDTAISFRANSVLVEAAKARARSLGMSLPELYRAAVRDKVLAEG
ncbi:hypothetical protein [Sphingopyxis sp. QXT-31]|uniref:hypothetical protein n=1 Tax=Sphingopyxis sp. QXT-31 TaxID=1357916 RepID=UPI0012EBCEC4|nr:hypothetical protein [Sphingopyxis sp. QXT-31]